MEKIRCRIHVDSGLARIAAMVMGVEQVAMVLGRTIHLYGASRLEFLADTAWLRHEACHVKQYQQYGMMGFLRRYLYECARKGYYHNRLEIAARMAETDPLVLEGIEII
ncbi:eCIS core domain-containing protein [Chitinophaga flava]|nr:DUF4157 domain-containing protein [Chitinophaga flava]